MVANHSTGGDVPTPDEFDEAQETHEDDGPYDGPSFLYAYEADEFDDYTEFVAYLAAEEATRSADAATNLKWDVEEAKHITIVLLASAGAGYLIGELLGGAHARL